MKIDPSKQAANSYQNAVPKSALDASFNDALGFEDSGLEGEFASVFEDVINRGKDKDRDDKVSAREAGDEKEKEGKGDAAHKKVLEKEEGGDTDGGAGGNAESNAAMSFWRAQGSEGLVANLENINARAILHIADLERIVASVRTQLLENGVPQITIDLKRSVLDGLQIKLSTDENRKVVAEFFASSEKAKEQVESKIKELSDLMQGRGIAVGSIKASLSGGPGEEKEGERRKDGEIAQKPGQKAQVPEIEELRNGPSGNETAYRV